MQRVGRVQVLRVVVVVDTGAVGEVVTGRAQGLAAGVAGGKVGQAIGTTDGLDVVHVALAAKVAGGRQVDLEGLAAVVLVVEVGLGGASHFDVVTTKEEERGTAGQANDVEKDNQLHSALGSEVEPLKDVATQEDANAGSRNGNAPRERAGHALAQVELGLQVLGQEEDEARDNDELHAGTQASDDVDLVGQELPGGPGDVLDVLAISVCVVVGPFAVMLVGRLLVLGSDGRVGGMVILFVNVHLDLLFLQCKRVVRCVCCC